MPHPETTVGNDFLPSTVSGLALSAGESAHPELWAGLVAGALPFLGFGRVMGELPPGSQTARVGIITGGVPQCYGPIGKALHLTATSGEYVYWSSSAAQLSRWKILEPLTVCAYARYRYDSGYERARLISSCARAAALQYNYRGYHLVVNTSTDALQLQLGDNTTNDDANILYYSTQDDEVRENEWFLGTACLLSHGDGYGKGNGAWLYVNGRYVDDGFEDNSSEGFDQSPDTGPSFIGRDRLKYCDQDVALVLLWDRILTDAEIGLMGMDPLAMFRPAMLMHGKVPAAVRRVSTGGVYATDRLVLAG